MATNIRDVSTAEFASAVLERSRQVPVVVDFWAAWCGPCKVLGPTLERLAEEGNGSWELAKIDVDQNQQLAAQFGVQGIPTVVAFQDGQAVSRFTGALPEAQVRQFIESLIPSELDIAAAQGHLALEQGNDAAAEAAWRSVLEQDPGHEGAGLGMAGLHLERGENEEAVAILGRLAQSEAVRRLQAVARLGSGSADIAALRAAADSSDSSADLLALGKALAARGSYPDAFGTLVEIVGRRDETSEEARLVMLDLFELLGPDHPLVATFRRQLASALF